MIRRVFWAAALAAASVMAPLAAQFSAPCNHSKVVNQPRDIQAFGSQNCGGININLPGGSFSGTSTDACPLFVLYRPPYPDREFDPDLDTHTDLSGFAPETRTNFRCMTLWVFFIPVSTSCELMGTTTVAGPATFTERPCN